MNSIVTKGGGGGGWVEAQRNRRQKRRWKGKQREVKVLKGKKVGELGEIMRDCFNFSLFCNWKRGKGRKQRKKGGLPLGKMKSLL